MQCACAVLHYHPGLFWFYHNLPHYLIKARFSEKQLTVTMHKKVGFDFLYIIFLKSFDVTTSIVAFLRGSNTQERDVTVTWRHIATVHVRPNSRGPRPKQLPRPLAETLSRQFIATIGTFEAPRFFYSGKSRAIYYRKCTQVFVWSTRYSSHTLMKIEFRRQIFEKISNKNFHENTSSGRQVVPCLRTDRY
jgi:hypothetical protein